MNWDAISEETNERFLAAVLITKGGREWLEYAKQTRPMPPDALEYLAGLVERNPSDGRPITELQRWFGTES